MKTLRAAIGFVVLFLMLSMGFALGCGATGSAGYSSDAGAGGPICQSATFRDCTCDGGSSGTQSCSADGGWGACACSEKLHYDAGKPGKPVCGDGVCNGTETCETCPADCGACATCDLAPGCTGASSVPASTTALASFNNAGQSSYASGIDAGVGSANCSDPLLKMRVSEIQIHKNGSSGGMEMFCMVQADDGQSSELLITPNYMNLTDNNPPLVLSPAAGLFWGAAVNGVKLSQFNITVTYQCYMVSQPTAFQNALNAVAGFAGTVAAVPGNPYGWAFGVGGAAAAAAAAATAAGSGATALLSVQQTIDSNSLLELTNGRTWIIEETGSTTVDGDCGFFGGCNWDWELDIEAWGCAAPKGQMPM